MKPKTPPPNDKPLSASLEEPNMTFHGAAESPNVHIAIRAFWRFSFHSWILDMLFKLENSYSLYGFSVTPFVHVIIIYTYIKKDVNKTLFIYF